MTVDKSNGKADATTENGIADSISKSSERCATQSGGTKASDVSESDNR